MPTDDIIVDGALVVPTLTVTIAETLYQLENFKRSMKGRSKKVYANHKPLGGVYGKDFGSWTGTLIAETAAPTPEVNAVFAVGAKSFIVTSVEESAADLDVVKWSISADELINPVAP